MGASMTHGVEASGNLHPGQAARGKGERCSLMRARFRGCLGVGKKVVG